MDFLKEIATPQSTVHVHLLMLMLNIVVVVFLPYLGFLTGCSALSLWYRRRARKSGSELHLQFSRDLIDTAMFSRSGVTFLLVIPAFSAVFILAQLLQSSGSIAVGLMGYASLALLVAVVFLYGYKYTSRLRGLLEHVKGTLKHHERPTQTADLDVGTYIRSNERSNLRAGRYGFVFLVLGSVLTIGSFSLVINPLTWEAVDSVFELFITPDFLVRYAQFVAIAFGTAAVGILYFLFSWEKGTAGQRDEYDAFIRSALVRIGAISLLLLPAIILLSVALLPGSALSGAVFVLVGLCFFFLFLTAHFLYAYGRDKRTGYLPYAFAGLLLALFFLFTKDQVAIGNATRQHAANLAVVYDRGVEELKGRLGIAMPVMSGEDIYNARCSACHLFDQKKIGPPYREVLPKYEGKKAQLVAFVLNPVKVDAAYPPMPGQGLKPAEADSIVTFLLLKLGGSPKTPATTQVPAR